MSDYQALHMIEAMRAGVSSREVGKCFSEARKDLLRQIDADLDSVQNERTASGIVLSGKYGEGKTHLLQTIFSMASERNMVVSFVTISKESPMDKLYMLYQKIVSNTYLPGRKQPGFLSEMEKMTPQSSLSKDMLLYAMEELGSNRLYYLFRAYLFTDVFEDKFRLQTDLEGDFLANATIKEIYSSIFHDKKIKVTFTKTKDCPDYFAFMSEMFHLMGYSGWVLLFDEAELIGRFSRKARLKAYRNMKRFLAPPNPIKGMYSVFVFSSSYQEDVIEGRNERMEIEKYFVEESDPIDIPQVIDAISHAVELKPLSKEEIRDIIDMLRTLHGKAYDWNPGISTDDLFSRTVNHGFVLRTRLRSVIECLDQLYQYGSIGDSTIIELQRENIKEEENSKILEDLIDDHVL